MTRVFTSTLITLVFAYVPCQVYAGDLVLSHGDLSARISPEGAVVSFGNGPRNQMLGKPISVTIRDEVTGGTQDLEIPIAEQGQNGSVCWFTQKLPGLIVRSRLDLGTDLRWEVRLENTLAERRDLSVLFDFAIQPADAQLFFPSRRSKPDWPQSGALEYGYRADGEALVIPSATVYSTSRQAALTVMSPLVIPIQPFSVKLGVDHTAEIGRTNLRLEPHAMVTTALLLSVHEPDWRPALKYIRDKYPQFFMARSTQITELNGPFLWSPTAAEGQVKQWSDEGVRWVEVHFTYPFLGKYAPDQPRWTPAIDDRWAYEKLLHLPGIPSSGAPFQLIRDYLEERIPPEETPSKVRAFIRMLHQYGIKALMYFQPTECWLSYATANFMPDEYRDSNGETTPIWYEDIVLNPRPDGAWATYLEEQFHQLLAAYPEADGVFMDEAVADGIDYGHDDGFTIRRGRVGYRMGYAICAISAKLVEYARQRGKIVWWNGPYQPEIGLFADGHLSESAGETIKWLGIGNKPITSGASSPDDYDRMLLAGSQCAAPSLSSTAHYMYSAEVPAKARPDAEQLHQFERYRPLFEEIRQREWILEANAVEVPAGFEANIFRQPNGNYAVPIVTPYADDTAGISFDVPVKIKVRDAATIGGVYLLDSDLSGWRRVPWTRDGNSITVHVGRHRRASLLLFAKTGLFAALDADGTVVEGQPASSELVLNNFLPQTANGELRIGNLKQTFDIAPNGSRRFKIPPTAFRNVDKYKLAVPIQIVFPNSSGQSRSNVEQEIQKVPALEVGRVGETPGYVGETSVLTFYVVNHSDREQRVQVNLQAPTLSILGELPNFLRLAAGEKKYFSIRVHPEQPGEILIHVRIKTAESSNDFAVPFAVSRMRFKPKTDLVRGRIEYAELVSSGMSDPTHQQRSIERPIQLDGQVVGSIQSRNQNRWLSGWAVLLTRRQLLGIGRNVEVTFNPASPEDKFRIRNIRLVLQFRDGSEIISDAAEPEFSTLPCSQHQAQPISVTFAIHGS